MRRLGITAAVLLGLLLSGVAFVFYGLPHFVRPELVRRQVLSPFESWTAGSLSYGRFEFSYFPKFKVSFFDARLAGQSSGRPFKIQAERVDLEPDSFPLLLKQFRIHHLEIRKAAIDIQASARDPFETLAFRDVDLEALPLGTLKALRIHTEGNLTDAGGKFTGDLDLSVADFSSLKWHDTNLSGSFQLDAEDLPKVYRGLRVKSPLAINSGTGRMKIKVEKEKGRDWFSGSGEINFSKLVYALPHEPEPLVSSPMDADFSFESTFDGVKSEWALQRSRLTLPLGAVEISGHGKIKGGMIEELRLSAPSVQLEQIPNYFISVKDALPFNIGFSGPGQLEMSLKGTRDRMTLYLNTDLGSSVLTYGRFLDKPAGVPFTLALEAQIKDAASLAGDLSVRFNDVLAKGTVKNLDFKTGEGQINLITNKHPVANWGPLVPMLKDLKLEGNMKFLANWEGDLRNLAKVKKVFNWTLEQGAVKRPDGTSLEGLQLDLDYDSGMGLVVKQMGAQIGGEKLEGQFSVFNPGPDPVIKLILSSPEIHLLQALKTLDAFAPAASVNAQPLFKPVLSWMKKFPPQVLQGKNFSLETELKKNEWHLDKFGLDAEGGRMNVQGQIRPGAKTSYDLRCEVDKAGLAFLFPAADGKDLSRGKLSVDSRFRGEAADPETFLAQAGGDGSLLMSGAEFLTLDLFEALSRIPELAALKQGASGKSVFDDARGHFQLKNGKFTTEDLVLLSPDFSIDAKGERSLDGQLNFRLDLYLSRVQAAKAGGQTADTVNHSDGEWFGPVPLLLTGTLAKPEIKADPQFTGKRLKKARRDGSQGAFRNFLREETLFDAAKKP